jgi:transcriptional regulator
MYLREVHAEKSIPALQAFIQQNPLGIFTTALASPNFPLLQCTHIPWVYDIDVDNGSLGELRGHLARNNPHAKALLEAIKASDSSELQDEVMILFNAPHHSYVTPQFYVQSKPADGKVVPTWNYAAAQVYGRATIYSTDSEFILKQVNDLTDQEEAREGKSEVWKVADAPEKYIQILSKAIIGIKIDVTRLEGKYKMSQESSREDRQGVIDGFEARQTELGRAIAKTVRERGTS